jgi:hypothetical protein
MPRAEFCRRFKLKCLDCGADNFFTPRELDSHFLPRCTSCGGGQLRPSEPLREMMARGHGAKHDQTVRFRRSGRHDKSAG